MLCRENAILWFLTQKKKEYRINDSGGKLNVTLFYGKQDFVIFSLRFLLENSLSKKIIFGIKHTILRFLVKTWILSIVETNSLSKILKYVTSQIQITCSMYAPK